MLTINGSLKMQDHYIIWKKNNISRRRKPTKKLYFTIILNIEEKHTSQIYFKKIFPNILKK